MATNRFDKPGNYDFTIKRYTPQLWMPNWSAWGSALENQEQQTAATEDAMTKTLGVNYIPQGSLQVYNPDKDGFDEVQYGDKAAYDQLTSNVQSMQKQMEEAALAGDMNTYKMLRTKVQKDLVKAWQPGGQANLLESRYKEYSKGLTDLQEFGNQKENAPWNATNKQYAQTEFLKNVGSLDYNNPKSVGAANTYPFVDVSKEINTYAKDLGYQEIEIEKSTGRWLEKQSRKYVTDADKQMIASKLNNPQYAKQLEIERMNVLQPNNIQPLTDAVSKANSETDQTIFTIDSDYMAIKDSDLSKLPKSKLQDIQTTLGKYYRNLVPNGVYNTETQQAYDDFLSTKDNRVANLESAKYNDIEQYVDQNLKRKYYGQAEALLDYKESNTLRADDYTLAAVKHGYANAEANYEKNLWVMDNTATTVPGSKNDVTVENLNDRFSSANEMYRNALKSLGRYNQVLGLSTSNDYQNILTAYNNNKDKPSDGSQNFYAFVQELKDKQIVPANGDYGKIWQTLSDPVEKQKLETELTNVANSNISLTNEIANIEDLAKEYIKTDEGKKMLKDYYNNSEDLFKTNFNYATSDILANKTSKYTNSYYNFLLPKLKKMNKPENFSEERLAFVPAQNSVSDKTMNALGGNYQTATDILQHGVGVFEHPEKYGMTSNGETKEQWKIVNKKLESGADGRPKMVVDISWKGGSNKAVVDLSQSASDQILRAAFADITDIDESGNIQYLGTDDSKKVVGRGWLTNIQNNKPLLSSRAANSQFAKNKKGTVETYNLGTMGTYAATMEKSVTGEPIYRLDVFKDGKFIPEATSTGEPLYFNSIEELQTNLGITVLENDPVAIEYIKKHGKPQSQFPLNRQ